MTPGRTLRIIPAGEFIIQDWEENAACKGAPVDLFFPGKGNDRGGPAKEICAGCPVRSECLEYALNRPETEGVWGGKNQNELRAIRRRRRAGAA